MTKNDAQAKQTVRVFSADGEEIGSTYPKRAKGLVKQGRARYVNDSEIRLIVSEVTQITEETKMDNNINTNTPAAQTEPVNRLYFSAREWSFNKECSDNVGSRSFMQGPDGIINEAYMIGDWGWRWTEIVSKTLLLPKNTLHTFTFWLNGGENDNNDETCRFEVIYNNDHESRYTYNLNRNFIRPLKKVNGWELYEIPFRTGDNEYTQLKFAAQRAYMTVLTAKDASEYADLADTVDPYEQYRPQRHNIVFNDGWPTNKNYSTMHLQAMYGQQSSTAQATPSQNNDVQQSIANTYQQSFGNSPADDIAASIAGIHDSIDALNSFDFVELREQLKSALAGNPHLSADDVEELIENSMENAQESISDAMETLTDTLMELNDSLREMQE